MLTSLVNSGSFPKLHTIEVYNIPAHLAIPIIKMDKDLKEPVKVSMDSKEIL
jgi:hypothetical protein